MSLARRRAGAMEDSPLPVAGVSHHGSLPTSRRPDAPNRRGWRPPGPAAASRVALRRLAGTSPEPDPVRRRHVLLLVDRVADVRDDLLEVADLIEQAATADPSCLAEVRRLLTSGCDSALYNPDIHVSELHASMYFLRCRLQDTADGSEDAT